MHRSCPQPSYDLLYPLGFANTVMSTSSNSLSGTDVAQQRRLAALTAAAAREEDEDILPSTLSIDEQQLAQGQTSPPPRICITTLTDQKSPKATTLTAILKLIRWRNFDGIMQLTMPNKVKYANKYQYTFYDASDQYDTSRPPAWSKIRAVQYLFQQTIPSSSDATTNDKLCDWVLWMDADTVIMNSEKRIEDFLPSDPTKHMIVVSDKGGGYNSGVLLFRNTDWSINFLEEWWNMNDFVRPPGLSLSGDNAALKALLHTMEITQHFNEHILVPPRCTMNSFGHFLTLSESMDIMDHLTSQSWYYDTEHYHKSDFIAHIPGFDNKVECLKLLLREAR